MLVIFEVALLVEKSLLSSQIPNSGTIPSIFSIGGQSS